MTNITNEYFRTRFYFHANHSHAVSQTHTHLVLCDLHYYTLEHKPCVKLRARDTCAAEHTLALRLIFLADQYETFHKGKRKMK